MKTSELTGAALDWAVTRAHQEGEPEFGYYIDHKNIVMEERGDLSWAYSPSTNWAQGGPIIEREKICPCPSSTAVGSAWSATDLTGHITHFGPTPLIAAMRCYVTSKLGDEVGIPEELI
jgi:hypothetical protein